MLKFPKLTTKNEKNYDSCAGCIFDIDDDNTTVDEDDDSTCRSTMITLTGVDCFDGIIFVEKEVWVDCSIENTKVGDEVRLKDPLTYATVDFIFAENTTRGMNVVISYNDGYSGSNNVLHWLNKFEVNTNK